MNGEGGEGEDGLAVHRNHPLGDKSSFKKQFSVFIDLKSIWLRAIISMMGSVSMDKYIFNIR